MMRKSGWQIQGVLLLLGCLFPVLNAGAMEVPEAIEINGLAELYQGVQFDHQMHIDLSEDCSVCHHHTTGTGTVDSFCARCHDQNEELATVACQGCHLAEPFSAAALQQKGERNPYHIDVSGLKGAYHSNCMGCHKEMGGPTGCQDCHPRTDAGDALFRAGKYAPKPSASHTSGH